MRYKGKKITFKSKEYLNTNDIVNIIRSWELKFGENFLENICFSVKITESIFNHYKTNFKEIYDDYIENYSPEDSEYDLVGLFAAGIDFERSKHDADTKNLEDVCYCDAYVEFAKFILENEDVWKDFVTFINRNC